MVGVAVTVIVWRGRWDGQGARSCRHACGGGGRRRPSEASACSPEACSLATQGVCPTTYRAVVTAQSDDRHAGRSGERPAGIGVRRLRRCGTGLQDSDCHRHDPTQGPEPLLRGRRFPTLPVVTIRARRAARVPCPRETGGLGAATARRGRRAPPTARRLTPAAAARGHVLPLLSGRGGQGSALDRGPSVPASVALSSVGLSRPWTIAVLGLSYVAVHDRVRVPCRQQHGGCRI